MNLCLTECPHCGGSVRIDGNYCDYCGKLLRSSAIPPVHRRFHIWAMQRLSPSVLLHGGLRAAVAAAIFGLSLLLYRWALMLYPSPVADTAPPAHWIYSIVALGVMVMLAAFVAGSYRWAMVFGVAFCAGYFELASHPEVGILGALVFTLIGGPMFGGICCLTAFLGKRIGAKKRLLIGVGVVIVVIAIGTTQISGWEWSSAIPAAQHRLTISSTAGGSVVQPGEGVWIYDNDSVLDLEAVVARGYRFVNWTGDVSTVASISAASTTITMQDDYAVVAVFDVEAAVSFVDANLEAAIREAIDMPEDPIYPSDLEGLTYLHSADGNIIDLTGLEHCSNLEVLHLQENRIESIAAVASLTDLTVLILYDNMIDDISPLAGLTRLTTLQLSSNQITNISSVSGLTSLEYLYLSANQISDASPLAGLPNLTIVMLLDNRISDVGPLVDNPGLGDGCSVGLTGNPLSEISRTKHLPDLRARGVSVVWAVAPSVVTNPGSSPDSDTEPDKDEESDVAQGPGPDPPPPAPGSATGPGPDPP